MATSESIEFYLRFVREKHNELINCANELISNLVSESIEDKKTSTTKTLKAIEDLHVAIPAHDSPAWLAPLISNLKNFAITPSNQNKNSLISSLMTYLPSIKNQQWNFDEDNDETAFDFDSIFEHYKSESRLNELFDEIIRILEDIHNSGEIDSIAMINALSKVIATLKKNKSGSYFSMNSAWAFVTSFLKHYFFAEISQIPVLGSAIQALDETIKEINQELNQINRNVESKMTETVEGEIKALSKSTEFPFLTYDNTATKINSKPELKIQNQA